MQMDSDKALCHSADKAITCEEVAYVVQRQGDRAHKGCAKSESVFLGLHSQYFSREKKNSLDHRSETQACFHPSVPQHKRADDRR